MCVQRWYASGLKSHNAAQGTAVPTLPGEPVSGGTVRTTRCATAALRAPKLAGVKLTRRRPEEIEAPVELETAASKAVGKGRPTPKRRDVVGVRGPVTAPKTRKEAYARQKQQAKAARQARRTPAAQLTVAQRRAALKAGDPTVLPRRDQGPTRQLARDYVDSHRMASNYLLALFPIMIISWLLPSLAAIQFLVLIAFLGFLVEWNLVGRRVRRMAIERNGSAEGGAMTIGFYAGSRAYLLRRWRLPAPRVELGETI